MKKISSFLLAGLFTASITACSQETINVPLQQTTQPNNVSTYSNEGLKSVFNNVLQLMFKESFDKNKDNFVSLDEYKFVFTPQPIAPPPLPPADPTEPPAQTPENPDQVANQVVAQSKKLSIPTDPTERFKRMDKNKDGKLSFTEVKNLSSYFVPNQKNSLRLSAKSAFEHMDQNKNKSLSKEEFTVANAVGADSNNQGAQILQGMLFLSADKNNNKSLSFSEFEDVFYNSLKTVYYPDAPSNQPPQNNQPPTSSEPATPNPITPEPVQTPDI